MKCALTIQEKLKDLRTSRGLTLEQLAEQTGFSKSALGSYETDEYKEISHKAITALARFYGVSSDYLLGLSENKDATEINNTRLSVDEEIVDIILNKGINRRLLREFILHPCFIDLMYNIEIYVEGNFAQYVATINTSYEIAVLDAKRNHNLISDDDTLRSLKACSEFKGEEIIKNQLLNIVNTIAQGIKENHINDKETADKKQNVLENIIDECNKVQSFSDPEEKIRSVVENVCDVNPDKMSVQERQQYIQAFHSIFQYSNARKQFSKRRNRRRR